MTPRSRLPLAAVPLSRLVADAVALLCLSTILHILTFCVVFNGRRNRKNWSESYGELPLEARLRSRHSGGSTKVANLTLCVNAAPVPQSARRAPCKFVPEGRDLEVVDAETDKDRTRSVLPQIIVESGSRGANLLPADATA